MPSIVLYCYHKWGLPLDDLWKQERQRACPRYETGVGRNEDCRGGLMVFDWELRQCCAKIYHNAEDYQWIQSKTINPPLRNQR